MKAAKVRIADWTKGAEFPGAGAYRMPDPIYHGDPCPTPSLNHSIARKILETTPRHAWQMHPKLNPKWEPDDGDRKMELGKACHAMLVGSEKWLTVIDASDYKSKAAKEERAVVEARGLSSVLAPDYNKAQKIVAVARDQLADDRLIELATGEGDGEVAVLSDALGFWQRIKLDFWDARRTTIIDYKTTQGHACEAAFTRQVSRMGYDTQNAYYVAVLERAFPHLAGRLRFVFVVQEAKREPFALQCFELDEADLEVARRKMMEAERIWEQCLEKNRWPAYPKHITRISMPAWHHQAWLQHELEMEEQ